MEQHQQYKQNVHVRNGISFNFLLLLCSLKFVEMKKKTNCFGQATRVIWKRKMGIFGKCVSVTLKWII